MSDATSNVEESEDEATVNDSQVVRLFGGDTVGAEAIISGTMLAYRQDWGRKKGIHTLRLNWGEIDVDSLVLAAVKEGPFVGSAHYLLYNVAPRRGGVDIRVHVNWDTPLPLLVDYFAILRSL